MPIPYQYPAEQWSRRKLRTQADVELAADIQRRAQSQVRGLDGERLVDHAGGEPVEQGLEK